MATIECFPITQNVQVTLYADIDLELVCSGCGTPLSYKVQKPSKGYFNENDTVVIVVEPCINCVK